MNKNIRAKARRRVRAGIRVLNEKRPGWFNKVSLTKLDLASCELCVLGQVYASQGQSGFYRGLEILNGKVAENPKAFGFDSDWVANVEYDLLEEIWKEEIAAQRRLARENKKQGVNV
jgi:hypothetical protein